MRNNLLIVFVLSTIIFLNLFSVGFCETRADKTLQNDILSNMVIINKETGEPIHAEIISQKVLKVVNNQETGQWEETLEEWIVSFAEQEVSYIIKTVPSAQGGVDYTIIPRPVAEKLGLLGK
jgi:hypothetical protein